MLQWQFPGDFGYTLDQGGPAWATWIAVAGALVALVVGLRRAPLGRDDRRARVGAAPAADVRLRALALVDLAGAAREPADARARRRRCGRRVPAGAIVYSDPESSYRIAAAAPVYICNAPPGHVADTKRNRPYVRRDAVALGSTAPATSRSRSAAAPRGSLIDRDRSELRPALPVAYRDARFILYRIPRE